MYSFTEFQLLEEDLQTQMLSIDGVYLELISSDGIVNKELYALYGFYVEIFFDRKTEEPLYLKAFNDMSHLDEYLELVDISDLQNTQPSKN